MTACAVYGCKSNNRKRLKNPSYGVKFYRFPKDKKMAKIWMHKCQRKDNMNIEFARICSKHFKPEHYLRNLQHEMLNYAPKSYRDLKPDAIPTENLPSSSVVKDPKPARSTSYTKRAERMNKRNRKEFIEKLLEEHEKILTETPKILFKKTRTFSIEKPKEVLIEKPKEVSIETHKEVSNEKPMAILIETHNGVSIEKPKAVSMVNPKAVSVENKEVSIEKPKVVFIGKLKTISIEKLKTVPMEKPKIISIETPKKISMEVMVEPNLVSNISNTFDKAVDTSDLESGSNTEFLLRQIQDLKKKCMKLEYENAAISKIFTETQVRKLKKDRSRVMWKTNDLSKAMSIYLSGPQAYRLLLKNGYPLPSVITLKAWAAKLNVQPGYLDKCFESIKNVDRSSLEKLKKAINKT